METEQATQTAHDHGDHTAENCPFENIPADRVFFELKLYLDKDHRPGGATSYNGKLLKELDVSKMTAAECRVLADMISQNAQQIIFKVGAGAEMMAMMLGLSEEENSGDKDGSNANSASV